VNQAFYDNLKYWRLFSYLISFGTELSTQFRLKTVGRKIAAPKGDQF
jgi:hypothetical protein